MTFQEAMRATSRELSTRATITAPGFSFVATNEHIMGFTVDEGGVIPLGTASSARCTLDLANANNEWRRGGSLLGNRTLIGATVAIEIGVYHDGAWDWQPVATFIVDETKAREHDTRFILTGNDPLARLDVKFNDTMRYTASTTLNDVLNHIKSKGVTINGTLAANGSAIIRYAPEWGDEPTIRQALCYVAQLGGSFVRCARNGSIELAPTNGATVHQINTSSYIDLTDEERVFLFNRIKLMPEGAKKNAVYVQSAVTSTPEAAANTLVIEGNPIFKTRSTTSYYKVTGLFDQNKRYYELSAGKYSLVPFENRQAESLYRYYYASTNYNTSILQGIADGLKTALNGLNLRAASFRWRGDPSIKIGDRVTVTDTRGVSFTTTVLRQTFRFDQGFSAEISCPVELEGIAPFIMPAPHFGEGSIPGYALAQGSIQAEHVAAGTISATEIAAKTITADEIATKTITADEIKAGTITADEVAAKTITADEIAAGTITATEIGASQITATHIGTNEIVANAANIKDGVITNAKIMDATIETAKIKDAQITTAKIADAQVTNAKIKDATIETAKIKDAQITTAKIADAQVTNAKIANATIETAKIKDAAITTAKIQDAQITNAKIASAGIDYANIKDVSAGTAIFTQGVGQTLYLGRLIVTDANFSSAIIGKLMIRDTDGKLYRINVASDGAVTATQVQVNGDTLTDNAVMSVSQRLLWRQATAPSAPWIGMLWHDTTLDQLKRCLDDDPLTWEIVPSGAVHTSVIDVDDTGMTVATSGILNLLSGASLTIKALGDTANIINMDNTGLTLSSTGQLKLQSTDSIIIGGSPFSVGGRNLIRNSGFEQDDPLFWNINSDTSLRTIGTHSTQFEGRRLLVSGQAGGSNNGVYYNLSNLTAPLVVGKEYVFSFWCYAERQWQVWCDARASGTGATIIVDQGGWKYVEYKFTANSTTGFLFIVAVYNPTQNQAIFLDNMQLEMGTVATDWSPSPQDTVDALDALDGRLGDVETRVQVFYQTSKPTYTAVGDLWYDTDSNPLEVWKCTNVSTQAHSAFTDPVLTRALSAQTTANSKITTFVGSTTPTALAAGDLWMDTGNKNIWKRATAAGTGGWVQYLTAAGYLITTGITIDGTDLTVKATGNLNLAADGNLNVQNGGNLNVLNGGDIEISNGGDINVASGGKINISATDLMISGKTIETYASDKIRLEVGGWTNLLTGTDYETTTYTAWGNNTAGSTNNVRSYAAKFGTYSLLISRPANDANGGVFREVELEANQPYTFSVWALRDAGVFDMWCSAVPSTKVSISGTGWQYYSYTFTPSTSGIFHLFIIAQNSAANASVFIERPQLEKGTMATAWSPSSYDLASGVKTSSVEVNTNGIYMDTTGNFNVNAGVNLSIKGGSGANSIGISNNPTDTYFMWAGASAAASAPFSVKRDGSVKATKIQHEYSQSFWDMADATFPAEFPVYIPSGYTIDSVLFTYQVKKARTFAKTAASGGSGSFTAEQGPGILAIANTLDQALVAVTVGSASGHTHSISGPGATSTASGGSHGHTGSISGTSHAHSVEGHTHPVSIPGHGHGINYGINEKTALATSSVLKVGATTIGTYAPNPGIVEIKAYMSANAWNTITVAPNDDARIVAYVLVKLTPN